MPEVARLFTPAEAAAVSGLALKAVNNVIDKRIVPIVRPVTPGKRTSRRYLTREDLLRLRLEHGLAGRLPVEHRQALFRELASRPDAETLKADDLLIVDIGAARRQVENRVRDLEEAEAAIHSDPGIMGGEPVIKGTRMPVYNIVAQLEAGATEDEMVEGRTNLNKRHLALARVWVAAHPRRGRPKTMADLGFVPTSTVRIPYTLDPLTGRMIFGPEIVGPER